MPRQYVSILLLGIVTISAVCLGLRWRVLAQLPEPVYTPRVSTNAPAATEPARAGSFPNVAPASTRAAGVEVSPSETVPPFKAMGPSEDTTAAQPISNSAGSAVQGLLAPPKPTQAKHAAPPAPEYPQKPKPVRLDINRATVEQLQALPGIGPTLAQRIVDYRKQHGPFKSVAELNNVKGIGDKKLADIKPWAYIGQ